MNKVHPHDGYQRVQFGFHGPYTADRSLADIDTMLLGEKRKIKLWSLIEGQNINSSCSEFSDYNHNLKGVAHGDCNELHPDRLPYDIYLERIAEDIWKIVVNTDFDNPLYTNETIPDIFSYDNDMIYEQYYECIEVPLNKKKSTLKKEIRHPAWGRAHLKFEIKFIRTPI